MRKTACFIFLFIVISLSCKAQTIFPLDTIPFEIGPDKRIYVTTFINEKNNRPLRFLVDTGATDVVINSNSPRTEGLAIFDHSVSNNSANSVEVISATDTSQKVKIGKQTVSNLKLISIPYPPDAWDGVLGLSFLKNFDVFIDYKNKFILLYKCGSGGSLISREHEKLKIEYRMGVPVVNMNICINGKLFPASVEIDTGSDRILDLNTPFIEKNNLMGTKEPFAISTITGTTLDNGKLYNVFFDYIKIGNIILPRIPGAFSTVKTGVQSSNEMDGVMGNNLLHRFNQIYDFKNNVLYLEVNDRLYTPFYDFLVH